MAAKNGMPGSLSWAIFSGNQCSLRAGALMVPLRVRVAFFLVDSDLQRESHRYSLVDDDDDDDCGGDPV